MGAVLRIESLWSLEKDDQLRRLVVDSIQIRGVLALIARQKMDWMKTHDASLHSDRPRKHGT